MPGASHQSKALLQKPPKQYFNLKIVQDKFLETGCIFLNDFFRMSFILIKRDFLVTGGMDSYLVYEFLKKKLS